MKNDPKAREVKLNAVWAGTDQPEDKSNWRSADFLGVDMAPPKRMRVNGGPTFQTIKTAYQQFIIDVLKSGHTALIQGPPGTGKTWMAWAAMYAAILKGMKTRYVQFWTIPRSLEEIRDYSTKADAAKAWTDNWKAHFLVVDDFFGDKLSSRDRCELMEAIEWRYEEELPTIFVSNQTDEALKEYAGSQILSRIATHKLMLNNADRRLAE
jgi:DNA replication protein DnaC